MKQPSFRQIAQKLGLSASTVSRALHKDPRIRPETAKRVMDALKEEGYELDPAVSVGMSKIRQRSFYRESIAWCGTAPRESCPWFEPMFQSAEDYGARLGYKIEHFSFERDSSSNFQQLSNKWKAQGIKGVVLGPFKDQQRNLSFRWRDFAWVVIGQPFEDPALHSVGRDYLADIRRALDWLKKQGSRRPCFLQQKESSYAYKNPLLLSSITNYNDSHANIPTPCFEPDDTNPEALRTWEKQNRPDGLILPHYPSPKLQRLLQPLLDTMPVVFLTSPNVSLPSNHAYFQPRFEVMGQASINLLHRLLFNRELGIPSYKQSIYLDSNLVADSVD
ncbi:MAG TPA: hypothetical protein DEA90_09550 [Opitutae bacterium]|nr:hypothetical protein [Puniceicoccaceae bacterium]HBR94394.1 hypothetical protein [Opitutae bacterium]